MNCTSRIVRLLKLVSWLTKLNWKMVKARITSMSGTKPNGDTPPNRILIGAYDCSVRGTFDALAEIPCGDFSR